MSKSSFFLPLSKNLNISGKYTAAGKFYRNADRTYSKINWFFLIFDFTTCSTLVIPVAIVTLKRYFTLDEMTEDQWIRPFYFEWVRFQHSNPFLPMKFKLFYPPHAFRVGLSFVSITFVLIRLWLLYRLLAFMLLDLENYLF